MISIKWLLEQMENELDPTPDVTNNDSDDSSDVDKYIQKVDSYMSAKGNPSDWNQLKPHLALYYDKIADEATKRRMYNEIGTVTADPTDVKAMNSQLVNNVYLNTGELNNLGRKHSITTKPPYNLPLVNSAGKNPGAGELSFQLAHPNIIWVGQNYPGDAVYKDGDKEYVIDVKDETKLGDSSSGIDMGNMNKG